MVVPPCSTSLGSQWLSLERCVPVVGCWTQSIPCAVPAGFDAALARDAVVSRLQGLQGMMIRSRSYPFKAGAGVCVCVCVSTGSGSMINPKFKKAIAVVGCVYKFISR